MRSCSRMPARRRGCLDRRSLSKYKNLIFSIPIKYGFSREESADIFQSVCLDILHELERLRDSRALAGWLIRITQNKCFHQQQLEGRHAKENEQVELAVATEKFQKAGCTNCNVTRR